MSFGSLLLVQPSGTAVAPRADEFHQPAHQLTGVDFMVKLSKVLHIAVMFPKICQMQPDVY